jgi:hypothetical protein
VFEGVLEFEAIAFLPKTKYLIREVLRKIGGSQEAQKQLQLARQDSHLLSSRDSFYFFKANVIFTH